MNITLEHTQFCRTEYFERPERNLGRYFGLSFLLHIISALLFTTFADRVINSCHREVFYIDLTQAPAPCEAVHEEKAGPVVKRQIKPPPEAQPVNREQISQPVKTATPLLQQTVFSKSAEPAPTNDTALLSSQFQGNPGPTTADTSGPQKRGNAPAVSGTSAEGAAPAGDMTFGSASGPSFMQRVLPAYPTIARRFNREGKVILRLTIDGLGSLLNVEVLQDPGYGFATAAVEAVRKSRFHPARHAGRPFAAKAILPIRFTLQGVN